MNLFKFLFFSFASLFLVACGDGNKTTSQLFDIQLEGNKSQFQHNETVGITLKNKEGKSVEKITYSIDGENLNITDDKVTLDIDKLGSKILTATVAYEGITGEVTKNIKVLAEKSPEIYTYEILNEYPHDSDAYTQGLEFYDNVLYESTGKKGKSSVRKVDYKTGEVLNQIDLENTLFGEGITILNGKIYQLTWQSGTGFIYDLEDFKKIDTFNYGKSKEGWGFCNDGEKLYKSDGTEKIWFINPDTLIEEGYIEMVTNKSIFNLANELEYVDGKIYANVYQKEGMMIINADTGSIEGVVNFSGLNDRITKTDNWDDLNFVLNGIAYHPERKTFFVTGKNWNKLFEVQIKKK